MHKKFVAVRHGAPDANGNLTPAGQDDLVVLAEALLTGPLAQPGIQISLLSSTAPRARQSGKLLSLLLGIPEHLVFLNDCFWRDGVRAGNSPMAKLLIFDRLSSDDAVIVVSHADLLVELVIATAGHFGVPCYESEVAEGQALVVDEHGVVRVPG